IFLRECYSLLWWNVGIRRDDDLIPSQRCGELIAAVLFEPAERRLLGLVIFIDIGLEIDAPSRYGLATKQNLPLDGSGFEARSAACQGEAEHEENDFPRMNPR